MVRFSVVLLFLIFPVILLAQFSAGVNDTINPGVPVTLNATYGLIGHDIAITDDGVEGPFPIGFDFSFFGNQYTEFYVGANGWISFSPNTSAKGRREAFAVPSAADYHPKNCILGPLQDMEPNQIGSPYIFYLTSGEAPQRKLVVMWCECPLYSDILRNDSLMTFQIILNEKGHTIENHIMKKPAIDWLDNKATLGLQNITGYIGMAVPGRNATSWRAENEGWRYTPTSADSFQVASIPYHLEPITPGTKIAYSWYRGSEFLSDQQSIVVSPLETATYRAFCTVCSGAEFTDSVKVYVVPYIPNAFTPNGDGLNDVFRILGLPAENITRYNFQVFDRWGEVVFSTSDIMEGWDGRSKGEYCPPDVYPWVVFWEDNNKTRVTSKGTIILVR